MAHTEKEFWRSVKRRGPLKTKRRYPDVTIPEIASQHPGSVYASLLAYGDWISKLRISKRAKDLTRLQGRAFRLAVEKILAQ